MEHIKLTKICNPKQWKTIPTSELLDDGYPVYGANGIIGYYSEYNHKDPIVAITCRGATCGAINITVPEAYVTGNAMCLDEVRSDIDIKYLFYCLLHYDFGSVISGSAQPQITRQGLEKVVLAIGTQEEQRSIIAILDKISAVIDARKQELKKLDDLIKARFVEMFGNPMPAWPLITIGDICADARTGPFGSALHHDEFVNEGIFVLGIDNAVENKFSYNRMRYITEEKYQQLKRYTVHPGDVIITIMGTIGRSAVIPEDMPLAINTKHLACLTPDYSKVSSVYLCNAFQMHPAVQHQLMGNAKGAIMDGLNLGIIKGLRFHLPPMQMQKDFERFYFQVDKSKVIEKQAS